MALNAVYLSPSTLHMWDGRSVAPLTSTLHVPGRRCARPPSAQHEANTHSAPLQSTMQTWDMQCLSFKKQLNLVGIKQELARYVAQCVTAALSWHAHTALG